MLKWNSVERPDFIQLEQILKDLLRIDNCSDLLQRLMKLETKKGIDFKYEITDLYKNLYQNVDQFLMLKRQEVKE